MTVYCRMCGDLIVVSCTDAQYIDWKEKGMVIQLAMPDVPKEERELLISGTCNECWKKLFRDEDED